MRDTSLITNFDTIYATGNYYVESKLVLDGVDYYESDLFSMRTSPALFTDVPSVGNCYSAEIDVVMIAPSVTIPAMAEMRPYTRLVGETLTSDWIPQGVFYIDTRELDTNSNVLEPTLTLHGYDAMLKAGALYPSDTATYPKVDTYVVGKIATAMGVDVDARTYTIMTDANQINLPATYTMREVLGYIASMYAGNFCMSQEGKLRLVGLTDIGLETNVLIDHAGNGIVFGTGDDSARILVG